MPRTDVFAETTEVPVHRLPLAFTLLITSASPACADDWPQWFGPQRDGVWRETGILPQFPKGGPKVRWRTPIGFGFAGPAVVGDRVYLCDRILPEGVKLPANPFDRGRLPGAERVVCLDDATGKIVWKHEYDCPYQISYPSGPRATPLVADGKVYALGAMSDLLCLDAASGNIIWSKNLMREYKSGLPQWGFAAHPLLDGDRLICLVGGDGCEVVALHKDTGAEIWKNLSSSRIGYCPPTMVKAGGTRQLIIWDPEAIHGLDPVTGKEFWSVPFEVKSDLSIPQPRLDGDKLFITSFYDGSILLKLDADKPAASVVWKSKSHSEQPDKTDALHSIMPTPVVRDGYVYGVCSYGQFRCLEEETGNRIWESMEPTRAKVNGHMSPADPKPVTKSERWENAFIVQHNSRFVLFNEHGDLILADLSPTGYRELDRAHIIDADDPQPGRRVVWSHPAFAHRSVYVRNNKEIVSVSLAQP
jgi:outer membrane protein assembly factor BamB